MSNFALRKKFFDFEKNSINWLKKFLGKNTKKVKKEIYWVAFIF